MQITRKSFMTGITRTVDLDVTQQQLDNYENGVLLQDAFPNLSPSEREFIKSGITDSEWESLSETLEDQGD